MSIEVVDTGTPLEEKTFEFNGKAVCRFASKNLTIRLTNWEKAGVRTEVELDDVGRGFFNEKPYDDLDSALDDYKEVCMAVDAGNYQIEVVGDGKIRLNLSY